MGIVANELAVSAMLSSLARRAICPNFIMLRGVFTCAYPPPESHWGMRVTRFLMEHVSRKSISLLQRHARILNPVVISTFAWNLSRKAMLKKQ
jgi:hypothetical protein